MSFCPLDTYIFELAFQKLYYQSVILYPFRLSRYSNLKIIENTLKINNWQKIEYRFLNISAHKNISKMVQYSKRTYGCHFSYETDPNNFWEIFVRLVIQETKLSFWSFANFQCIFKHFWFEYLESLIDNWNFWKANLKMSQSNWQNDTFPRL